MIKFGTSGWRGVIADDFTFSNVRLVTQAIADYVKSQGSELRAQGSDTIVVGYDTRFLSEKFAEISCGVLAANGIKALYCKRDTPTPVISYEVLRRKAQGAINFTASHNPAQYNGLKFSPSWGGPALPETTKAIENKCQSLSAADVRFMEPSQARKSKLIEDIDPRPPYLKRIKELINFPAIKKGHLRVATDCLYGTGIGYLDEMLDAAGVRQKVIHNFRDVLYGGRPPEPNAENLKGLYGIMKKESCHLGLSTDADADRFGILDSDGSFINPNEAIAIILYHLIRTRQWKGVVARSVMTTHLIDRIAKHFNIEVRETPVGFKYIGEILVKEKNDFIIGGEESGGLTIRNHVPEKDGVLACLLAAETVAMAKKPLRKVLDEIGKLVGMLYSDRVNFHLTIEEMNAFRGRLATNLPVEFGGLKVENTITVDGYKFILSDGSWLGVRLSGTEPVVRLYIEADSQSKLKKLASLGTGFIKGKK